ncbi:MAG: efflux RND transporter permease subunit [Dehalococcoidales bacterium]|nr:efflux RND transporter permease subunit [Dehalococcoidales bacterium]
MFLAKLAIRQPIFVSMVLLAITLVGFLSYSRMGVDLYPDMSNPVVSVSIAFPGASPQDVETLVTKPVEESLSTVNGVDSISASSREGSAQIMVSFVIGHDLQQGAQEVRERLDVLKRRLPDGTDEPVLRRFDPNTSPFMTAALAVKGDNLSPSDVRRMVEEIVVPRLERISGVAAATVSGLQTQEVGVDLNAGKLKALRVSPQQVVTTLRNENVAQPSGRIYGTSVDMPLRTTAEYKNLDDIRKLVVARTATGNVLLQDVADVNVRFPARDSYNRVNGQETMSVGLQKQSGANEVAAAKLVRDELAGISRDFPQLQFTIIRDDSTFIDQSDRDVTLTLIIGALLAAAIVLLFFRNFRNTLITVAGLPIVVIGTFSVMYFLGFTRNIVSLMALSLSVGLLIDDAIVVRENIFRYMEGGASPREAAEKATGEIAFAVLAISLTIVAIFIPVTFTTGQVGRLLNEFGITVAAAVMISLFEAFTFAPLLTAYFAKPLDLEHAKSASSGLGARLAGAWPAVANKYRGILEWALRHRIIVVAIGLASLVIAIGLLRFLPMSFFPVTDPSAINVGISLPPGTPLDKTDQVARVVEKFALEQPEVTRVYCQVGQGSNNQGSISVTLAEGTPTEPVVARFRQALAQYGRTVTFSIPRQFMGVGGGMGGGSNVRGRPVVVVVRGPVSLDTLCSAADQVIERLHTVPGITDVDKSLPAPEPEMQIVVDRQRTAQNGVSAATVGSTIRTLVSGTSPTQVDWNDQRLNVNVQLRDQDLQDISSILDLSVAAPNGTLYPLRSMAHLEQGTGPTILERQDRQGQITVGANLEGRSQGAVTPDVQKALSSISLPAGVTWRFSGQQAQTQTAFGGLFFALVLGLIFVYMVLASQFGSLIHPVTVMVALPMSAIGAVLALVAVHADLTIVAMIGIILLMGLATKNSILLVDFIIRYRKQGKSRTEAVLTAGPVRLRPIVMTTLAIILGMVPTALGLGAAGAFRAPMAIAVIGGIFSSTLLSLVVVPVAYTLMDDMVTAGSRLFHRQAVPVSAGAANAFGSIPEAALADDPADPPDSKPGDIKQE